MTWRAISDRPCLSVFDVVALISDDQLEALLLNLGVAA